MIGGIDFSKKPEQKVDIQSSSKEELRKKTYEQFAQGLVSFIKQVSEIPIPKETILQWKTLMSSAYTVDHTVDAALEQKARLVLTKRIVDFLHGEPVDFSDDRALEKALQDIRSLSQGLPERERQFFLSLLLRILKVTESMKSEESPQDFIRLRKLEGQMFAKLFLPFLPEEFKQSADYPKLVRALKGFFRAGNMLDSFVDFRHDFENGQIKVKPSLSNRMLFAGNIFCDSLATFKETGVPRDFIKRVLVGVSKIIETK